jgi:hypothetical protein
MRECRSVVTDHISGIVLGTTIFVLLPAFIIAGAIDCASTKPGLHCAVVEFVLDDGHGGRIFAQEKSE